MKCVERVDYNKVITIKLVIPSGCNAACVFCYLNGYRDVLKYDLNAFKENYLQSLDYLLKEIGTKNKVSLDITGNEPTLNVELLRSVLHELKEYDIQSKVCRVTITTNGTNLLQLCDDLAGVVNYVNISVHHFDPKLRQNIMNMPIIPDEKYAEIIRELGRRGITCSAVAVIYRDISDFTPWCDRFIDWAKNLGFIALRLRCDVFWKQKQRFEYWMYMYVHNPEYTVINYEHTPDAYWARLRRNDKFRLFFLEGVTDTSLVSKGIEYVIADDGKAYCDYYKRVPIEKYAYEIGKIFDVIDDDDDECV